MSATSARLPSPFSWRGALSASVNLKQTALSVMAGLVPAIHAAPFPANLKLFWRLTTWMTGTSPVMTVLFPILV